MNQRINKNFLNKVVQQLKEKFKQEEDILSLYIYGSILSKYFNLQKSDVDVLMIVKNINNSAQFIKRMRRLSLNIKNIKLDLNIVFYDEFNKKWHIYRTPLFFIGVKYKHKLVLGKDLIRNIKESKTSVASIYKRIVDLAQGSRGIYVNNKEPIFWEKKYIKWLRIIVLEILYLTGNFELHFLSGLKKIQIKYRQLKFLTPLKKNKLSISEINNIAEKLKVFVREAIIKSRYKPTNVKKY